MLKYNELFTSYIFNNVEKSVHYSELSNASVVPLPDRVPLLEKCGSNSPFTCPLLSNGDCDQLSDRENRGKKASCRAVRLDPGFPLCPAIAFSTTPGLNYC